MCSSIKPVEKCVPCHQLEAGYICPSNPLYSKGTTKDPK